MELLLVRHGLPVRIDAAPDGGAADPGLSPEGWEQAESLARWLHRSIAPPTTIYVSPLQRAVDTAAPLAKLLELEPEIRSGLAEFDRGARYYVPLEELRAAGDPRFAELVKDWTSPERAAEREAFRADVVAAVNAIAAAHEGETVAVVCHGGVINAYLSDVLGITATLFFEPQYTSISRVKVAPDGRRMLRSANETPHF